jgi:hypothetical protein
MGCALLSACCEVKRMKSDVPMTHAEWRTEVVKNTCANLRAKETRKWSWEFSGNPHSSGGAAGFHKRKGVKFTRGVPTN